jgi:hypothetical protein
VRGFSASFKPPTTSEAVSELSVAFLDHRNHAKAADFGRDVATTRGSARSVSSSRASYIYISIQNSMLSLTISQKL